MIAGSLIVCLIVSMDPASNESNVFLFYGCFDLKFLLGDSRSFEWSIISISVNSLSEMLHAIYTNIWMKEAHKRLCDIFWSDHFPEI